MQFMVAPARNRPTSLVGKGRIHEEVVGLKTPLDGSDSSYSLVQAMSWKNNFAKA